MARIATIVRHGRIGLRAALCAVAVLAGALVAPAEALNFPALTGRVVDEAGILDASVRSEFIDKLAALETKTTDQLVVATVRSLENTSVEDYANRLFRQWKLGQKDKNNGVLLLVAPSEHKVRIEVGYGLEGTLTDAVARFIIETSIVPRFRSNDLPGGIRRGVDDIILVLTGAAPEWKQLAATRDANKSQPAQDIPWAAVIVLALIIYVLLYLSIKHMRWTPDLRHAGWQGGSGGSSDSGWSGGFSGGDSGGFSGGGDSGFSGGGGSSGGGGASGSW